MKDNLRAQIVVVDIETLSARRVTAGIVEIGAIFLTGLRAGQWFERKCRPPQWMQRTYAVEMVGALEVNGCDWYNDMKVASEEEAAEDFAGWLGNDGTLVMAGQNVGQFDYTNLEELFKHARLSWPFSIRVLDLQSLAFAEALKQGAEVPAQGMTSGRICDFLGLMREPKPHRALCGALLEHRALHELLDLGPVPECLGELEARFFPVKDVAQAEEVAA
jgi:DNA polymerase III epsilon subunit-like protein